MAKGFFGGVLHLHPKGTFDLLLLHPYAWIEVKRPDGKPVMGKLSDEQLSFASWLCQHQIPNAVVDNADDAVAFARSLAP
jgi:hypothetical protein